MKKFIDYLKAEFEMLIGAIVVFLIGFPWAIVLLVIGILNDSIFVGIFGFIFIGGFVLYPVITLIYVSYTDYIEYEKWII